jgi:flagellar basal body-associated protein FliL
MSTPESPQKDAGAGPPAKKSSTWIIVLVLAIVLAIPALCVCAGMSVALVRWAAPGPMQEAPQEPVVIELPDQGEGESNARNTVPDNR